MFQVEKRDGTIAEFQMKKITDAIGKAFGAKDMQFSDDMLQMLALRVTADFQSKIKDGKISVESEPGKGTCFTFTLPILKPEAGDSNQSSQINTGSASQMKSFITLCL